MVMTINACIAIASSRTPSGNWMFLTSSVETYGPKFGTTARWTYGRVSLIRFFRSKEENNKESTPLWVQYGFYKFYTWVREDAADVDAEAAARVPLLDGFDGASGKRHRSWKALHPKNTCPKTHTYPNLPPPLLRASNGQNGRSNLRPPEGWKCSYFQWKHKKGGGNKFRWIFVGLFWGDG